MSPILQSLASGSVRGYGGYLPQGDPAVFDSIASSAPTGVSTVTFSNISQDYKHLELHFIGLTTSQTQSRTLVRINGQTSGYTAHYVIGDPNNPVQTTNSTNNNNGVRITDNQGTAGIGTSWPYTAIWHLPEYTNTSMNKSMRYHLDYARDVTGPSIGNTGLGTSMRVDTTAVTSITVLVENATNYANFTQISLYGIKG